MRLYVDGSKCTGCKACLVACSLNLFRESNPKKSALNLLPHFPAPGVYEMKVCTQCGDCAKVCPTEAIKLNERGAYYVDFADCNLCEACVPECPAGRRCMEVRSMRRLCRSMRHQRIMDSRVGESDEWLWWKYFTSRSD
jgi:ferredoxin